MSEKIEKANELYETVKKLSLDLKETDQAKAKLIIEYAEDAIASYENSNQEKKSELRDLIKTTKELIPPENFRDLKTLVESKFLKIVYPKSSSLRNMFFVLVAFIIIISGLLALRNIFPTVFSTKTKALTNELETLTSDELKKLEPEGSEGGAVWLTQGDNQKVIYSVYNGSNYKLKEITVHIICVSSFGSVIFDKDVSLPLDSESSGEPFNNSNFSRYDVFPVEWTNFRTQGKGVVSAKGIRISNTTP